MFSRVLFGFCYADLGTQAQGFAQARHSATKQNYSPPHPSTPHLRLTFCVDRAPVRSNLSWCSWLLLLCVRVGRKVSPLCSQAELTRPVSYLLRMTHVLQFEDKTRKVKDASMQDSDTFEIYDPRNPVNKRRREESKKLLREKKERR